MTTTKQNVLSVPLASVTTRNPDENKNAGNNERKGPRDDDDDGGATPVNNDKKTEKKKVDKTVIFINDKGTAKMVEVKTGISDYDNIEILSGISDSAEVVTGPFLAVSKRLKDGEKIRKQEKKEPEKKED